MKENPREAADDKKQREPTAAPDGLYDLVIAATAGPEPVFDRVMRDWLEASAQELQERSQPGSLLDFADLGRGVPWLWRFSFRTRGLVSDGPDRVRRCEHHVVGLRILPDYLFRARSFELLWLVSPSREFHPNVAGDQICVEIFAGEPLVDICESLHRLFSWRLRQLEESDALNAVACEWGRRHLEQLDASPLDTRPLFGRQLDIRLEALEESS